MERMNAALHSGGTNTESFDEVEKGGIRQTEEVTTSLPSDAEELYVLDEKRERRLNRIIDLRLVPILGLIYSLSLLDRANVANARVAGMGTDLGLSLGERYSIVLLMFFPSYVIFELPSNILMRKVGAANWLSGLTFLWGAVMVGMAFINKWQVLILTRFLLGAFEAGFLPGCILLLSAWYKRDATQKRMGGFYLFATLVGNGFGNILAYGLMHMEGIGGLRGWRWIFLIEGLITCLLGVAVWFLVVDYPDKPQSFLKPDDYKFLSEVLRRDKGTIGYDEITWQKCRVYVWNWRNWVYSVGYMSGAMGAYTFAFFLPIILDDMGYSASMSQLLAAPPYVFAVIGGFILCAISDKLLIRGPFIIGQTLIGILGISLMAFYLQDNRVRYAGSFLGLLGIQSNIPSMLTYANNNILKASERSFASALMIGWGGIGGIITSTTFRQQDAPNYLPGMITVIVAQILNIICVSATYIASIRANRDADAGKRILQGSATFRYVL